MSVTLPPGARAYVGSPEAGFRRVDSGVTSDWCATYSPTCGICRERRKGAREALRKARATMACVPWSLAGGRCWSHWLSEVSGESGLINHNWAASALLDGFTVAEITEAGG